MALLSTTGPAQSGAADPARWEPPEAIFDEVASAWGLDFEHFNGNSPEYYFPELVGAGAALFDYDNDGDLDAFLVQGARLEVGYDSRNDPQSPRDRLFRNDLGSGPDGSLTPRFVDVTEQSRIDARGFGMGVTTGDFNNDGWTDLYVTNFGSNQLLRNNGDGTFSDVTAASGTDDPRWSTSATFVDYDRDGWLDLMVLNYVNYSLGTNRPCYAPTGARDYCGPLSYSPAPDSLFRNRGDGTFADASASAGILSAFGTGLGVTAVDFNGDGWLDLYVANDQLPNQLWINQRNGTFLDDALLAGCALDREGQALSSMGVDAGDFDNDGDDDLLMTHLTGETNTIYVNDGGGLFTDRSPETGLGTPSVAFTGFGAGWLDFDNDGWLDLWVVNGAVKIVLSLVQAGDDNPYHQLDQLFQNLGSGRFRDASEWARPGELSEVGRGLALGDIDNDGDVDGVVANNAGPARLLRNRVGSRRPWVSLRFLRSASRGDALGTRVEVVTEAGQAVHRRSRTDGSYCAAHDPRVSVGLGSSAGIQELGVLWMDGSRQRWTGVPAGAHYVVVSPAGPPGGRGAPGAP